MFDISSTKLLILGIVALLVVGPKDLPMLLRTVGKYMGIIRRQAAEFRTQFDDAMRETELAELKKDVETFGKEAEATLREAELSVNQEMDEAKRDIDADARGRDARATATLEEVARRDEREAAEAISDSSAGAAMAGGGGNDPVLPATSAADTPLPVPARRATAAPELAKTGA